MVHFSNLLTLLLSQCHLFAVQTHVAHLRVPEDCSRDFCRASLQKVVSLFAHCLAQLPLNVPVLSITIPYLNSLITSTNPLSTMCSYKRERSTTPETKPAGARNSPKKKTPSNRVKGEDGTKDEKAKPWTAEEDAALMSGVREVIAYVSSPAWSGCHEEIQH